MSAIERCVRSATGDPGGATTGTLDGSVAEPERRVSLDAAHWRVSWQAGRILGRSLCDPGVMVT